MIDTRELGRRAGSLRRVSRHVPAPAEVGNAVLGVPAGEPVELDLRLEAVVDGVLVSGTARTRAAGECVRCLDPVEADVDIDLQELYAYGSAPGRPAPARAATTRANGSSAAASRGRERPTEPEDDDEDEVARLDGDLLDLEPALRDALVLALPLQPLCDEECPGLCVECGARLADDAGHTHASADPRWAALAGLVEPGELSEPSEPDGQPGFDRESSADTDGARRTDRFHLT